MSKSIYEWSGPIRTKEPGESPNRTTYKLNDTVLVTPVIAILSFYDDGMVSLYNPITGKTNFMGADIPVEEAKKLAIKQLRQKLDWYTKRMLKALEEMEE